MFILRGVYPYDGTLQRYMVHPLKWLHKLRFHRTCKFQQNIMWLGEQPANYLCSRLPDNVTFAEGALLEPLSVAMSGIKTANLSLGRGVVICGAGPIGLITLAAARASGAHPIVITDIESSRLSFAKSFVPSCITYQVNSEVDVQGNARAIRALFGPKDYFAPEAILECTGVESSVCTAIYTVRRGGKVVIIGVGKNLTNNLPFMHLSLAEVSMIASLTSLGLLI
jgi:L-iditol 2-dehydrogenase